MSNVERYPHGSESPSKLFFLGNSNSPTGCAYLHLIVF